MLVQVTRVDISFKSVSTYELVMPYHRPDRSWWGLCPLRIDSPYYAPEGSLLVDKEYDGAFVNSGTHQIPLFNGLPPEDILQSKNPFETLLKKLKQQSDKEDSNFSFLNMFSFPSCTSCCCCLTASTSTLPFSCDGEDLILNESGASIILRIYPQCMIRFVNEHIKVNGSIIPNTNILNTILETHEHLSVDKLKGLYEYEPLKYAAEKTVSEIVLKKYSSRVVEMLSTYIMNAINIKFQQDIQEYIDHIP